MTPRVTSALPDDWQGSYTVERAQDWIEERDREGITLLAIERSSKSPIGLVILFDDSGTDRTEIRLGYLLSEVAWGKGFASELVQGVAAWCRDTGVASIVAGVAQDNLASRRVLEKTGFALDPNSESDMELLYELQLKP